MVNGQCRFTHSLERIVFYNRELVKKNQSCRCLVFLHMSDEKNLSEINEYLKNLIPYSFDSVVTVLKGRISRETCSLIYRKNPEAKVKIVEDRGLDLLPFLNEIKSVDLDEYDIVFKLQSQSTDEKFVYAYRQLFLKKDLFVNLFEGILSEKNVHKTIDTLYNRTETGMVAASNLIVRDIRPIENLVQKIAEKKNLEFYKDYRFAAGRCFAVKADCLKYIQKLHLENNEFISTVSSRGLLFADFVERYLCISVLLQGYQIIGNQTNTVRRLLLKPITMLMNHYSSERLLHEDIVLDDEWFYWQMYNKMIIYRFDNIKLSDMKCVYGGKFIRMIDGIPYRYIREGDITGYEEYSKTHRESGLPLMTRQRYDQLIESINKNGYDERSVIIVNDWNCIIDGQHRACVLANELGEDSYVRVLKITNLKKIIRRFLDRTKLLTPIKKLMR